MNKVSVVLALLLLAYAGPGFAEGDHRFGGGANYWVSVDDIDFDDVDDDGFSYLVSYQYWPALLGLELDLEILPDKYGETAFAPQAFIVIGTTLYAAAGVGIEYRDSDFADEPFFALRAGLNLELVPSLFFDIYGLYRFNDSADLDNDSKDIDSDTVFLGAAVRVAF